MILLLLERIEKEEILNNIEIKGYYDVVYFAGSLAEGIGNEYSDIDVYVITSDLPDSSKMEGRVDNKENYLINNFFLKDRRVDVEYWDIKEVEEIIEKLKKSEMYSNQFLLNDDEIDFLHRFKYAIPIKGEENYFEIKNKIEFQNFDMGLTYKFLGLYEGTIEDIEGCIIGEDYSTALKCVSIALDRILQAYLCSMSETNPRNKWIFRKLKKVETEEFIHKVYKMYTFPETISINNVTEYIHKVLSFTSTMSIKIQQQYKVKL